MKTDGTQIGAGGPQFPPTAWSVVLGAQGDAGEERRQCLERLASAYWKPVYWYIRHVWSRSNEDAKDLTQDFFAQLLDPEVLAALRAEGARFRSFVRASLENFLRNRARDAGRLKRGGGRVHLSIEDREADGIEIAAADLPPDRAFDRAWAHALLSECAEALRSLYASTARGEYYEVFARHQLAPPPPPTYEETARLLSLSVHDVQNRLRHARRSFRELLLDRVRQTLSDPAEAEREIAILFSDR